jgi:predicted transcriptional regulator
LHQQLDELREANADLAARLRADSDFHARDRVQRSAEQLADQQRHEREIEAVRQSHTAELSHLMATMLEQVDTLQREQAARVAVLQAELDRLKRMSPTASESSTSGAATQILNEVTAGGAMQVTSRRQ